jgi:hypothetical protein
MMDEDINRKFKDLQEQIDDLRVKRIHEHDILPGEIKSKHISEGVKWIRSGLSNELPLEGPPTDYGSAIYFETNTGNLNIWNGSQWLTVTLA